MNRDANILAATPSPATRSYRSPIRTAQATQTRRRILDAVLVTMGQGITELSIPAVAREAGVSTRTVYRHFPTKARLVDAVASDAYARDELERIPLPTSPDGLDAPIQELFRRLERVDPLARAALLTRAGGEARRASVPHRLEMLGAAFRSARPSLDVATVDRLSRVALILTSSFALQAWKDYLGASAEEAASDVAWALRSLIAGAEARS